MIEDTSQAKFTKIIDAQIRWLDWRTNLGEVFRYRYLLQNLIRRDLKVRYRNSILGILWSLLNPLLMMLVFSIIFGKLIPREDIRQYPVFFLVGLLPWHFFSSSLLTGTASIIASDTMVKKIFFPRELLPASAIVVNLVNFLISLLILVVFLFVSGLGLSLNALWVPVLLVIQFIFTLGLVLILSALNVFYRDVIMVVDVVILAWFFMTPIIYPLEWLGKTVEILGISMNPAVIMRWVNPMASLVDGYRTVLWGTMGSSGAVAMDPAYLLRTFVTAALIFIVGYALFSRLQHLFAEKL